MATIPETPTRIPSLSRVVVRSRVLIERTLVESSERGAVQALDDRVQVLVDKVDCGRDVGQETAQHGR